LPAVFLALKDKETPPGAKIIAAVTVGYALPIALIWLLLILIIVKRYPLIFVKKHYLF